MLSDYKYRDLLNGLTWAAEAPCGKLDHKFTDYLFFPAGSVNVNVIVLVKHLCNQCPLRRMCLDYQIMYEVTCGVSMLRHSGCGVFGGVFSKNRRQALQPVYKQINEARGVSGWYAGRVIHSKKRDTTYIVDQPRYTNEEWSKFDEVGSKLFEESKCSLDVGKHNPTSCFFCFPKYKHEFNFTDQLLYFQELYLNEGAEVVSNLLKHIRKVVTPSDK